MRRAYVNCICIVFAFLCLQSVKAEEVEEGKTSSPEAVSRKVAVRWYQPEVVDTEESRPDRTRVIVSGQTEPGAIVSIEQKTFPVFFGEKLRYMKTKAALKSPGKVQANSQGYFEFELNFPQALVQLPIAVRSEKDSALGNYQLNMKIERKVAKAQTKEDLEVAPLQKSAFNMWMGAGYNFLRYQQSSPDIGSDLSFESLQGPSYLLQGGFEVSGQWDVNVSIKSSPGAVQSSDTLTIDKGKYSWMIYALEAAYFPESWRTTIFKLPTNLGTRFGIQYHQVPFLERTGVSSTDLTIGTNTLTMFTGGVQANTKLSRRWTSEVFLRYQYPLATGSLFSIQPKFAFDGSMGIMRRFSGRWRLGGFWYGQWHEYNYNSHDAYLDKNIGGSQTLFFSNIELRLGYEFAN